MRFKDVVVLVPGFLGFTRLGGFYYFGERIAATLRGALARITSRQVPVIPVSSLPVDRLANRQHYLMRGLERLYDRMGGVERFHLVGHSAGGVDAQLVTCPRPLRGQAWSLHEDRLRARIKTVVCIAAPHHGTGLANAPLAKFLADPIRQLTGAPLAQLEMLPAAARQAVDFYRLVWRDRDIVPAVLLDHVEDTLQFLREAVRHRGLIDDLSTRSMEATRRHWHKGSAVLRSFVTVAPAPKPSGRDSFYRDLYHLTASGSGTSRTDHLRQAAALLQAHQDSAIASHHPVPSFDSSANDGVINSVRQLLDPSDPDELAGIVVGDHLDVIGHYDRHDPLLPDSPLNMGLFHSGAGFRDDQFYELYDRVAEMLGEQMVGTVRRAPRGTDSHHPALSSP